MILSIIVWFTFGLLSIVLAKKCATLEKSPTANSWKTFISTWGDLCISLFLVMFGPFAFLLMCLLLMNFIVRSINFDKKLPWSK